MYRAGCFPSWHFNPRSPHGERPQTVFFPTCGKLFQSTLPARGATDSGKRNKVCHKSFQSTLPARGATSPCHFYASIENISIHAPRTGSDEGGRFRRACPQFQSTLPARGATDVVVPLYVATANFNPRSPHGERLPVNGVCFVDFHGDFNPRSPHGERRRRVPGCTTRRSDFNPRSPHGERRYTNLCPQQQGQISIHAPRTGSDEWLAAALDGQKIFQSTLPARGATEGHGQGASLLCISIHAPRTGSDDISVPPHFSLCGISIHAPRTGSDVEVKFPVEFVEDFNPRSPHGERLSASAIMLV